VTIDVSMPGRTNINLESLFYPKSIALIGASNTEGKLGYNVFKNLISHDYQGKLYPINPKADYIQGIKAYPDILSVEGEVDAAILIVPAQATPGVVEKCCEKGVKFIINEAAGFSEVGNEGKLLEEQIKQVLENSGSHMVGPNCSGIINTNNNMVQSIGIVGELEKGNVGLIAQAGVYAAGMLWGLRNIMKFGTIATVGNKVDINETDILEFMGNDSNIEVICMYIEDVKAGRKFIDVAREVTSRKPIIALKSGRTDIGTKAAASHTASIAGNAAIYSAVFDQCGIIKAADNEDMFDTARAFSKQPPVKGQGVLIISYAGSMGVTTTDTCYENGLRLAELSEPSLEKLRGIIPPYVTAKNPADLTFDQTPEQVSEIIRICTNDDDVSAFVAIIQAERAEAYYECLKDLDCGGKPLLISIPGKEFVMDSVIKLEKKGFPVYETPETAVKILSKMYKFHCWSGVD